MLTVKNQSRDPYLNQALEEYLFSLDLKEDILYFWKNDQAIVFGSYQNPFVEIDLPNAWKNNFAIIRRISGGGTVYHDSGNLNYTLIRSVSVQEMSYDHCIDPIVTALNSIGYPVEKRNSCDIYLGDCKISGSAQKRQKNKLLHHGTLLFDCDLEALRNSTSKNQGRYKAKGIASRPAHVGNLSEIIPKSNYSIDDFQNDLESYFFSNEIPTQTYLSLTSEDWENIEKLAIERYQSWEWTFGKTPALSFENEFRIDDVEWKIKYQAKHAVIHNVEITKNGILCSIISDKWLGLPLEKKSLTRRALEDFGLSEIKYII